MILSNDIIDSPSDDIITNLRNSCHIWDGESDTIFITGIKKKLSLAKLAALIKSTGGKIVKGFYKNGKSWIKMGSISDARTIVNLGSIGLHDQSSNLMKEIVKLQDRPILIRFELGTTQSDRRLELRPSRSVEHKLHDPNGKTDEATIVKYRPCYTYNNDSISISTSYEEIIIPTCTGRYMLDYHRLLTRMNEISENFNINDFEKSFNLNSHNETKELAEVMAMISAVKRVIDSIWTGSGGGVIKKLNLHRIYYFGDGRYSVGPRLLAIYILLNRNIFETLPEILCLDPAVEESHNIEITPSKSYPIKYIRTKAENYPFENDLASNEFLTLFLSRHSHAPLESIWKRVYGWTISISIPCCGTYGIIKDTPLWFRYEDYELPSPKRSIMVHKKMTNNLL